MTTTSNPNNLNTEYRLVSATSYNLPSVTTPGVNTPQTDCPRFTKRFDEAADWASGVTTNYLFNGSYGEVTAPNGTKTREYYMAIANGAWCDGLVYKTELSDVYENSRWARNPQSQDIDMAEIVKTARAKQPGLIVVDRAVPGVFQNYLTPEQHIPETGLPYPWETCMTMANSWSYVPGDQYKPTDEILEKLVDIVSKGGNYLLNIGPSPEGEWDPTAYERLQQIGAWMKVNGAAIYATRKFSTFGEGERIRFTQSKDGKTRYVFLFDPPEGKILLTKMPFSKNAKVTLYGKAGLLPWRSTAQGVEIRFPAGVKSLGEYVWVLKVE